MATVRLAERSVTEPGRGRDMEAYYTFIFVVEEGGEEVSRHPLYVPADSPRLTQERLQGFVDDARARLEARVANVSRVDLEAIR